MNKQSRRNIVYPQQQLTIVAITWNLFASLPPKNSLYQLALSSSFLPSPDLIFIGTQECQRSLFMSFCCEAKDQWQIMLAQAFPEYYLAATDVMRGLHSAILLKPSLRDYFRVEGKDRIRAGACGIMGNKGAISLDITILGLYFQFINCHLAPHQNATNERNSTVQRIMQQLVQNDLRYETIFLGDFNYRIEMTKQQYQLLKAKNHKNTDQKIGYSKHLYKQQLLNQRDLKNGFLKKFQQAKIEFPPTYKMGVDNNQYNLNRIPGWTDRIFSKIQYSQNKLKQQSYKCEYNILGCDHRPVLARYIKMVPQNSISFTNNGYRNQAQSNCQLI